MTSSDLIRRYLENCIAAERAFEPQLREFSEIGDDDDVKNAFLKHANEAKMRGERLSTRLAELGGDPGGGATVSSFTLAPRPFQITHVEEERIVQNLLVGYTIEAAECAIYEALATVSAAAGDLETAQLARQVQRQESLGAGELFHFIKTRSIIAYNMLTIEEVDPSVETKIGESPWT